MKDFWDVLEEKGNRYLSDLLFVHDDQNEADSSGSAESNAEAVESSPAVGNAYAEHVAQGGESEENDGSGGGPSADSSDVLERLMGFAYPGESRDREMLEKNYHLSIYLDSMERKHEAAGEDVQGQMAVGSDYADEAFFPRLYKIARTVLDRLRIPMDDGVDVIVKLCAAEVHNGWVFLKHDEDGVWFEFVLSSFYLKGYTDDEIAALWGMRLYENLSGVARYVGLVAEDDDSGEMKLVLPTVGQFIFARLNRESQISADRMAVIAAGGVEPAMSMLIKERFRGELGDGNLVIPDDSSLDEMDSRTHIGGAEVDDIDFIKCRLKFMRIFGKDYQAGGERNGFEKSNQQVAEEFETEFVRTPGSETQAAAVQLIACAGLDMILQDENVRDEELRCLLDGLFKYDTKPLSLIIVDAIKRAACRRKAERALRDSGNVGALQFVGEELMRVAMTSGPHFEQNVEEIEELLKSLGANEVDAHNMVSDLSWVIGASTDPIMDAMVQTIRNRMAGKAEEVVPPLQEESPKPKPAGCRNVDKVRYSGDLDGVRKLGKLYHLETILALKESVRKHMGRSSLPRRFLNHLHLTPEIAPRVSRIIERVKKALGYTERLEVFCGEEPENDFVGMNAYATMELTSQGRCAIILITPETIEKLDDDELAYLIGHEMGHLIYAHNQWGFVVKDADEQKTMLPFMGDRLYWEWNQKCEISADRAGAVAAGNAQSALSAQLKVCYRLSPANIDVNADVLMSQLERVKATEEMERLADHYKTSSHPLDQLRIKALKTFCDAYFKKGFTPKALQQVDAQIAKDYETIRRYPRTEQRKAMMQTVATAGWEILLSDGEIADAELTCYIKALSEFTDDPLAELLLNQKERQRRLTKAARIVEKMDDDDKEFLMALLAVIMMADGEISASEREFASSIAGMIGIHEFSVDSAMEAAVGAFGFRVDYQLEEWVRELKQKLV